MSNKRKNKGFTLIELIAVIVILGLLMVIVIPAVTRYIDNSKKETYLKEINSLVDTVRYGINSGDSAYSMDGQASRIFDLSNIKNDVKLEKGKNTIIEGQLIVTKNNNTYKYNLLISNEENGYCISLSDVASLNKSSIVDCSSMDEVEFSIGRKIWFAGSFWYVINDSKYKDSYVTLLKDSESGYMRFGSTGIYNDSVVKDFLNTEELDRLGSENLVNVDGYQIRIINETDLIGLGCVPDSEHNGSCPSEYSWLGLGDDKSYFRMPYDGANEQYVGLMDKNGNMTRGMAAYYGYKEYVRPVINLLKSVATEDIAKKEIFITNINSLIDIVKNNVNNSNSKYYMGDSAFKWFTIDDILNENNTVKKGFVQVTKNSGDYEYKVRVTYQTDGYCFKTTDISELKYDSIVACSNLKSEVEYKNGDVLTYNDQTWYVIGDSYYEDGYVKLLKSDVLTAQELGPNATSYNCSSGYVSDNYYGCKTTSDKYAAIKYSNSTSDNSYNNSLINSALNNYYLPILGEENLENVDGYKIKAMDKTNCSLLKTYHKLGEYWTSNSASAGKAYTCSVSKEKWSGGFTFYNANRYQTSLTQSRTVLPMINLKKAAIQ